MSFKLILCKEQEVVNRGNPVNFTINDEIVAIVNPHEIITLSNADCGKINVKFRKNDLICEFETKNYHFCNYIGITDSYNNKLYSNDNVIISLKDDCFVDNGSLVKINKKISGNISLFDSSYGVYCEELERHISFLVLKDYLKEIKKVSNI